MANLRRGIAPELLRSQVKNTMPYLFEAEAPTASLAHFPPAALLRSQAEASSEALSHFDYFRLCVSAHYLTCGTPVPTDVDNQIRQKLWPAGLPLETALAMTDLVLESRSWDFLAVTSRFVRGPADSPLHAEALSGHLGEWFTLSAAAYCALTPYKAAQAHARRQALFEAMREEVLRHSEVFAALWRAKEGVACLKASASIAHNFGDLDRVIDMWSLPPGDPLRLELYNLATQPFDASRKLRHLGRLWVAGELYKAPIDGSSMALENHRHFALRKPKCLRQSLDLLIPSGPFFDDWGRRVAGRWPDLEGAPSENTIEVFEALKQGWERLPKTVGYGRALRGMLELSPKLDVAALRKVQAIRALLDTPQDRFEQRWGDEALRHMDEIPSRA